jgi:hypothetical protein
MSQSWRITPIRATCKHHSKNAAIRHCFTEYLEQQSLVQQLDERERRLFKGIFAMLALALQLPATPLCQASCRL